MKQTTIINLTIGQWFDRTYGNTYTGGKMLVCFDDGSSESINIPFQYGYGQYWNQAALERYLEVVEGRRRDRSDPPYLTSYCRHRNIAVYSHVMEGMKKRDLMELSA